LIHVVVVVVVVVVQIQASVCSLACFRLPGSTHEPCMYSIVAVVERRLASVFCAWSRCSSWTSLMPTLSHAVLAPHGQYGVLCLINEIARIGPFFECHTLENCSTASHRLIPVDQAQRLDIHQYWVDSFATLSPLIFTLVVALASSSSRVIFNSLNVLIGEMIQHQLASGGIAAAAAILFNIKHELKSVCPCC
jgi:hypothetical protein